MVDIPAIDGLVDASDARVMLWQNQRQVHAPVLGIGLQAAGSYQPLDADLTSWAAITRASGFDTFVATPSSANLAALVTDESGSDKLLFGTPWVTYTPTFTGFGTPTGVSVWSRRIGDTLWMRGSFTGGTSTATEARMTLGFNGTNANVNSDATKVPFLILAGTGAYNVASATMATILIESNVGYITFGSQQAGTAGLAKKNGDVFLSSGQQFSFTAQVPISGW
jgi:hypothetical protein